jgi:hypothetical protein
MQARQTEGFDIWWIDRYRGNRAAEIAKALAGARHGGRMALCISGRQAIAVSANYQQIAG